MTSRRSLLFTSRTNAILSTLHLTHLVDIFSNDMTCMHRIELYPAPCWPGCHGFSNLTTRFEQELCVASRDTIRSPTKRSSGRCILEVDGIIADDVPYDEFHHKCRMVSTRATRPKSISCSSYEWTRCQLTMPTCPCPRMGMATLCR